MGDKNVPVYFNNLIQNVYQGLSNTESYFDDVFVADDDMPTHVTNIEAILRRSEERNVKISFDKLQLGFSDLQALGFDFKGHQYKPRYELR